ncbi:SDR family NAD(P)-dependent oxidoreductase [Streptomyces sp. NPDC004647]|uniref:SDR family NAD(P)-dependent oxidoreductase n=1 Tax=Streptomyces sp. NPDC004647 TaxID=3154671 RepID=UPI0033BEF1AD
MIPVATACELRPIQHDLTGRSVLVISDGDGLADVVRSRLVASGAEAEVLTVRETVRPHARRYTGMTVDADELAQRLGTGDLPDWVFFLEGYTTRARADRPFHPADGLYAAGLMRTLFQTLSPLGRRWVDRGTGGFAVVSNSDGRFGLSGARSIDPTVGTLHGVARALHSEIPVIRTVILDAAPSVPAAVVADRLLDLASDGSHGHREVGLSGAQGYTTTLVPTFDQPADLPGADGELPLDSGSTVVATGGGRGVTAEVVRMMAAQIPCRYLLLGTTEVTDVRAALGISDRDELLNMTAQDLDHHKRRQFIAMHRNDSSLLPPAFERHWSRITNSLAILQTLARVRDLGARAEYVQLDVTDAHRTRRFCDVTLAASGPVHALLHGAGIEASSALCGKTLENWERTAAVKTGGLYNLTPLLSDATRLIMLFGSAAGTYGSPGQLDYAGASEFLTTAAYRLAADFPAARVRSVAWPAWAEVGMAVRPSSQFALEQRDVEFMKVPEGLDWAEALMRSPGRTPAYLTLGYRSMPSTATATRTIAPWDAAPRSRCRLVDTCHESGSGSWELRWIYQPELDAALADHRVGGSVRVPIAHFTEMVCQSVHACLGEVKGFTIKDLRLLRALTLAPERCREVRIAVERESATSLSVRITSSPVLPDHTWLPVSLEHLTATVDLDIPQLSEARVESFLADASVVPVEGLSERFAANGIDYGPAFREIVSCRRSGSRHHVELRSVPAWNEDVRGRSVINIGLLDLALQALCFNPRTQRGGLPTAVAELRVYAGLGEATAEGVAVLDAEDEQLNVTLADSQGRILLEIHDLKLTRLDES